MFVIITCDDYLVSSLPQLITAVISDLDQTHHRSKCIIKASYDTKLPSET